MKSNNTEINVIYYKTISLDNEVKYHKKIIINKDIKLLLKYF